VWIGQRHVDCRRHPRTDLVHPVHIRPGAFAEDQPKRDLWLSPDHALFHDGVLIPAHCLINGATVVQEQAASVHYFHIELDRHDIVLAEGLAAESYLNTGNRAQFENGAAHISLHADFTPRGWDDDHAYAPLCTAGPIVDALNQQLWQRAVALGSSGRDADLQVEVDGRVFRPAAVKGQLHRFLLPASTREARIVSRPGVRIGAILADGGIIGLDTPALAEGFLPLAQSGGEHWRAIDGRARLLLPERFGHAGGVLLEVLLHDTKPSRQSSPPAALAQVA
jgi:Hint domain-containing protein